MAESCHCLIAVRATSCCARGSLDVGSASVRELSVSAVVAVEMKFGCSAVETRVDVCIIEAAKDAHTWK